MRQPRSCRVPVAYVCGVTSGGMRAQRYATRVMGCKREALCAIVIARPLVRLSIAALESSLGGVNYSALRPERLTERHHSADPESQ